jgi:dihydroorotate dehydrogenase
MYSLIRDCLFRLDAETSHELTLDWLGAAERLHLLSLLYPKAPQHPVEVMGLRFANPVGLAAGLDKNADYFNALGALGFGFVEVGTVTPLAQPGNPKPRLFRLPDRQAVINRMGFNNKGVAHLVSQVAKPRRYTGVLGINIGKNKNTPDEQAFSDYAYCLEAVYPYADYVAVNISSPNTPGLRNLQFGAQLSELLTGLKSLQQRLQLQQGRCVPLAVKIAPDMTEEELREVAARVLDSGFDAIIATNTTLSREGVEGVAHAEESGGLSGAPVKSKSTQAIRVLAQALNGRLPIIGVGGIFTGEDALEKLEAGASLVQVYSGFIYEGPKLVSEVARACALADLRPRDGGR